jgi:hypothetical protein
LDRRGDGFPDDLDFLKGRNLGHLSLFLWASLGSPEGIADAALGLPINEGEKRRTRGDLQPDGR